ncbi:hypothetical protein [uncultured Selenomonas sp.]|jgi:hypothetical protein|uniref:hypothetical protein n=1 Tax=uncultured Selenomonas sp. TaxID=159275 RepID=UPI002066EE5B|nr:hypothetical protein [uncultured Selenomonas sp.]DAS09284.1 MAG TPA: hypothetical protein [Caudoviricetes sp.]DAX37954.1 MAG TPA: hypothetical protein [Caudoviricetes sp.]
MEFNWTSVMIGIGSTMFGIILHQSREIRVALNKEVKENRDHLAEVHKEIETLRSALPLQYVLRDDFLRSISALDTKIDRMSGEVSSISKNIAKLTGGEK